MSNPKQFYAPSYYSKTSDDNEVKSLDPAPITDVGGSSNPMDSSSDDDDDSHHGFTRGFDIKAGAPNLFSNPNPRHPRNQDDKEFIKDQQERKQTEARLQENLEQLYAKPLWEFIGQIAMIASRKINQLFKEEYRDFQYMQESQVVLDFDDYSTAKKYLNYDLTNAVQLAYDGLLGELKMPPRPPFKDILKNESLRCKFAEIVGLRLMSFAAIGPREVGFAARPQKINHNYRKAIVEFGMLVDGNRKSMLDF